MPHADLPTLLISGVSVLLLLAIQYLLPELLARWTKFPSIAAQSLAKSGPLFVVIAGTAIVAGFELGQTSGMNIVGEIPRGLPKFALPALAASDFLPLVLLALTHLGREEDKKTDPAAI